MLRMLSMRALRRLWPAALVILVVSGVTGQAQSKPSGATAAEQLSRSTAALARLVVSDGRSDLHHVLCAR